ncbi:MAG: helix-turn-helix domain-containing protein [Acidimicrobiia bacterium]
MSKGTYARDLGKVLRQRRRMLGLTQTEVAELAGTTQRTVSEAEAGSASGFHIYASVADVLGLQIVAMPAADDRRMSS